MDLENITEEVKETTDVNVSDTNGDVESTKSDSVIVADDTEIKTTAETNEQPKEKTKKSTSRTQAKYSTKECKVLRYRKKTKQLDILFDGYGIRLKDVPEVTGDTVTVKYKGKIGTSDFECVM